MERPTTAGRCRKTPSPSVRRCKRPVSYTHLDVYKRQGYENIVCAQPFGCLPNHICGKGMVNKIRELYPEANITPIDYDPSATRVNQENRIKLMLAVARERLSERREPPADLPKVRTSVSAKLTKPKSLCANI